jgi:hypothetical protein
VNPLLVEGADIAFAREEPEEFRDDRSEVEFLRGDGRESPREIEAEKTPEDRPRAHPRALAPLLAPLARLTQELGIGVLEDGLRRAAAFRCARAHAAAGAAVGLR